MLGSAAYVPVKYFSFHIQTLNFFQMLPSSVVFSFCYDSAPSEHLSPAPSFPVSRCELRLSVLRGGSQRCAESIRSAGDHYGGSAEAESCTHPRSPPHSRLPPARAALSASLPTGETHGPERSRTVLKHVPGN